MLSKLTALGIPELQRPSTSNLTVDWQQRGDSKMTKRRHTGEHFGNPGNCCIFTKSERVASRFRISCYASHKNRRHLLSCGLYVHLFSKLISTISFSRGAESAVWSFTRSRGSNPQSKRKLKITWAGQNTNPSRLSFPPASKKHFV